MANLVSAFRKWLRRAAPGSEFLYHNGLLAFDRCPPNRKRVAEVDDIAKEVWAASQRGLVLLVQRRLPYTSILSGRPLKGGCLYLAVRTQEPIVQAVT